VCNVRVVCNKLLGKYYYPPTRPTYNAWKFFSDEMVVDHRKVEFLDNNENSYYANYPNHMYVVNYS
jgi:hypothetical protein